MGLFVKHFAYFSLTFPKKFALCHFKVRPRRPALFRSEYLMLSARAEAVRKHCGNGAATVRIHLLGFNKIFLKPPWGGAEALLGTLLETQFLDSLGRFWIHLRNGCGCACGTGAGTLWDCL